MIYLGTRAAPPFASVGFNSDVYTTDAVPHTWSGSRLGIIRRLFKSFQRSFSIAQNRRRLHVMPDYLLKDIGISRSDIDSVVVSIVNGAPDPTRRSRGRS
jgi:uncharacterized protein YjiS (DUF1127 family)